ncbi:sensor histidine kinase [Nocardioides sp. Kera G14]|uniref:sensor histidine kinase n=1 Tax=Nocardioides sp. Kera G14 TaxID=2884264 RepID=UPI001D100DED|nr:HAMP domain-containing sensor histidine kinase [Nocardioides sp. Kera G14]UDY24044.1 HAMP domain-containing histidine kinase [Nocardioides sp. Kera G14]
MRRSLTTRLVATTVALVLAVSLLVATLTALALHSYLGDRLDKDVVRTADRWHSRGPADAIDSIFQGRNQEAGTLVAVVGGSTPKAVILGHGNGEQEAVDLAQATDLAAVPTDGALHDVDVPGYGTYRVVAQEVDVSDTDGTSGAVVVSGLPVAEVDDVVTSLVRWELGFIVVGLITATAVGLLIVRRQLGPLREVASTAHEVAQLPLADGDVGVTSRVPARLTDERTEVGAVGAALNVLLEHVESSLAARERSEQQVRRFVADASHELRTPLTTIRGYADLASQRPEQMPAAIAKVKEESARMSRLVEDLLQLARLDAGRPPVREEVDLSKLLAEVVSDTRVVDSDHHWRLAAGDRVQVEGDQMALHQVATNLLNNARKHTPAGTTVTVTTTSTGFSVHDDGPGFEPELVPSAFQRFVRGDSSRQRSGAEGGAGLGLALVQAIVESHGGTVSLASEPGDTTITVTL